jgi:hypothetical protein
VEELVELEVEELVEFEVDEQVPDEVGAQVPVEVWGTTTMVGSVQVFPSFFLPEQPQSSVVATTTTAAAPFPFPLPPATRILLETSDFFLKTFPAQECLLITIASSVCLFSKMMSWSFMMV